jgi:hypothetical protein
VRGCAWEGDAGASYLERIAHGSRAGACLRRLLAHPILRAQEHALHGPTNELPERFRRKRTRKGSSRSFTRIARGCAQTSTSDADEIADGFGVDAGQLSVLPCVSDCAQRAARRAVSALRAAAHKTCHNCHCRTVPGRYAMTALARMTALAVTPPEVDIPAQPRNPGERTFRPIPMTVMAGTHGDGRPDKFSKCHANDGSVRQ